MKNINDAGTLEEIIDALADKEWNAEEFIEVRHLLADQFGFGDPGQIAEGCAHVRGFALAEQLARGVAARGAGCVVIGVERSVSISGVRRRCTLLAVQALKRNMDEHGSRALYG